ncbi:MAG: site-2 protease family protein [Chloroflexi bacterium]|nr:site-2 protease family protein [Chloroflexota bacterium]
MFFEILLLTVVALLVAVTVHEFSHALIATGLGDTLPRRQGRLSLNPVAHLDPLGTLMLFLVGFGWGKPVPINPLALRGDMFRSMSLVAVAGPLSNVATAVVAAIPFKLGVLAWPLSAFGQGSFSSQAEAIVALVLAFVVVYNLLLAVFNLIPLFPLDGSRVVLGILPRDLAAGYARLEPWGPGVLLVLIVLGSFTDLDIIGRFLGPVVNALLSVLVGGRLF